MRKTFKSFLAFALCILMMLSVMPMSAFAAFDYAHNEATSSDDYYDIISKKDWDIAPGITETEIVLNNAAGDRRQVVHMMEADLSNQYTRVISSYTNMDTSNYAISTIPEHAAFIENEWGENVVGAMNTCLSWYNTPIYAENPSRVHEPLGFMMVDSEIYFDHSVGFPTCIVIHKDTNDNGETRPVDIPKVEMRTVTDTNCLNGWEDQVIPCSSGYIVKDGVNQYAASHGTDTAARSVVGVKADGSVVIMMNDGRQAPYSLGMNMYECAEVMIAAGCVYAANCDGGGSSTFMSQRPGEELAVNCSPCDGSLRQNTHGIIFISTAPATGEFYNAFLKTENEYYVPNSVVEVTAIGRDFSGAEAAIPEDAVWTLADDSFGTIENGVFTSNGKLGDVEIELNYNGEIVGSTTIYIVNPESIAFAQSSTVIPYGKSIVLDIKAMYGVFEVAYTAADFDWAVSDESAGTRDGLSFTATNDSAKTGVKISATYKYADLGTSTLDIVFGKGSEILYNFENGDISHWLGRDALVEWATVNNPDCPIFDASPFGSNFSAGNDSTTFLATAENGKVKNGKYALGVELDYTHSGSFGQWSYNMFFNVGGQTVLRDTANGQNATKLGMWIYIPEELAPGHNLAMQAELYCGSSSTSYARKNTHLILECNGKTLTKCTEADIPEDRWVYCYMDLTPYNYVAIQNPYKSNSDRREPQFIRFYTQSKEPFNAVFYFDDITLDYSDAVDDRNAPIVSDMLVSTSGTNIRSFSAKIADYVANNASGLNYASANIYVDGIALNGVIASGSTISSPDVTLTSGAHTVTFEIADNMGNKVKESLDFTVQGTAAVTVNGHNDLNNVPQYDSVYYVDIDVDSVENINSVTTDIYLNFANNWELDNMIVADGFEATYSLNKNNNVATITITNVDNVSTGATTLVSIPVRIWSWDSEGAGFESSAIGGNSYPLVYVKVDVRKGSIAFVDGTNGTFNGALNVDTALLASVAPADWHSHTVHALDDADSTCTSTGYAGRTYCDVCGSVIDWGTTIPATGHSYELVDGALTCSCGRVYVGQGLVNVNGKYYFFTEKGLNSGWLTIDDEWYYFDATTYTAVETYNNGYVTFEFEETGKLISGQWYHSSKGSRYYYGPTYYYGRNVGDRWYTIDGKEYCFNADGYCLKGYSFVRGYDTDYQWYDFGEDGAYVGKWDYTGLYNYNGYTYSLVDGITIYGFTYVDGAYYYAGSANNRAVVKNIERDCPLSNGLLPAGTYRFGADGKLIDKKVCNVDGTLYYFVLGKKSQGSGTVELNGTEWTIESDGKVNFTGILTDASGVTLDYTDGIGKKVLKNGPNEDGYFYLDDVKQTAYQLIEFDGNYYYIGDYHKYLVNNRVFIESALLEGTSFKPGYYSFDAEGKMILKNGPDADGYFYLKGVKQTAYQLVEFEGNYYYVGDYHKYLVNNRVFIESALLEGTPFKPGYYSFDEEGKMILKNGPDADGYFYLNGVKQTAYQLIEFEGNYYYVGDYHKYLVNNRVFIEAALLEGTPFKPSYYSFDEEGKMILKNGPDADGYLYLNGVKQTAYQLVEFEGNYYYVGDYHKYLVNNRVFIEAELLEGTPFKPGYYSFDEEGKMILKNGPDADGYFYINGVKQTAYQLVEFEGDYYYVGDYHKYLVNNRVFIEAALLEGTPFKPGYYSFDEEGKMIINN